MFLTLSKTLDLFVAPVTWVLILTMAAAWGAYRHHPALARSAPLGAALLLFLFSWPPVADALARELESSATTTMSASNTYDVVVLLGGVLNASSTPSTPEYSESVDRLLAVYDVLRLDRARHVIITSDAEEASVLANQLAVWGVARDRIVIDTQSRNTHENALRSAEIIRDHSWSRILLVTSALHMARAAGCFRAAGLTFDTLPVDRLASAPGIKRLRLAPRAEALVLSTAALREATGRVMYRAAGYVR